MELRQKGEESAIDASQPLTVSMNWTTAADFDLAAAYETTKGKLGIVYFGDRGSLEKFPYMMISEDKGVDDTGGNNEEELQILRLDHMKYVWIFCWDYNMVRRGQSARFNESDVRLTIIDVFANSVSVSIDTGDSGNVCCIATIDNTNPGHTKLVNYSQAATLRGLKTLEQLVNVVRQFNI
jgi:tellurite resistance protein TerA